MMPQRSAATLLEKRGLPTAPAAERLILGSILRDNNYFADVAAVLTVGDFSLEKHRRIFRRISEVIARDTNCDRIVLTHELIRYNELQSVDGLSYLIDLEDGLPKLPSLAEYIRIVKDKSRLRRIAEVGDNLMLRALAADADSKEILESAESMLLGLSDQHDKRGMLTPLEVMEQSPGGMRAFIDPTLAPKGVLTGFLKLDEMTGGLHPGELIIIAARPGGGKSALSTCIAQYVAKSGGVVDLFSLEMSADQVLKRIMYGMANVDSHRARLGYVSEPERARMRKAVNELVELPLFISDSSAITLMDVHAKVTETIRHKGRCDLVIVDYLQLMGKSGGSGKSENRQQEVSAITRGLKLLAMNLNVPVLALCQLNRNAEERPGDHRPQLNDLRESGEIEAASDVVMAIFREELYKPDRQELRGLAELIVMKQRNGPVGTVNLIYLASMTRFVNRAEDIEPEGYEAPQPERLPYREPDGE